MYYSANTSSLDADTVFVEGEPSAKPGFLQQRFGVSVGGPLNIPHIYHGGSKTFFFLNYNGSYGDTPYDFLTTVPTALERSGDFSQTLINGQPVQIFNPATGQPFANATIPHNLINSASTGLAEATSRCPTCRERRRTFSTSRRQRTTATISISA